VDGNGQWVKFVGSDELDEYHGTDQGKADKAIDLFPGDVKHVSDEKAAQLHADFGEHGLFEFDVPKPDGANEDEPSTTSLDELEPLVQLQRLKLAGLAEVARLVGIEGDDLDALQKPGASKAKAIEAIAAMKDLDDVVELTEVRALVDATAT
jgi:hypothetical protein